MKIPFKPFFLLILTMFSIPSFSQKKVEYYKPIKNDSIRVGTGDNDFLPFIKQGYTILLPEATEIIGVLIFLEDSGYNEKNKSARQLYNQATNSGFAVLSVSTEIPFDFYFSEASMLSAHQLIQKVFS